MAEEKSRKTLANCSAVEGLKQINAIRREVSDFYALIDVESIKAKYQQRDGEDAGKLAKAFMDDLLNAALDANAERAVEIVGLLAFMPKEESLKLTLDEAYDIITDCMQSKMCMDFFSNVVRSVTNNTDTT